MNQNIYIHAINAYTNNYNQRLGNQKLATILKTNALLSRKMQGINESTGFNGIDYISLCDYQKRNIHPINHPQYTSYESYIKDSISIIISKEKLETITPNVIDIVTTSIEGYKLMYKLGNNPNERYSDFYDEVQVKDQISLDKMCGLTIPVNIMTHPFLTINKNTKNITNHLLEIESLLTMYNHNVPIYDIDTMDELTNEEDIKRLVKYYTKKI